MRTLNANIFLAICFSTIVKLNRFVSAIACYKCSTLDNDKVCVDPFNPGLTQDNLLESTCYAGMDGRTGLFPAGFCLKITGTVQTTGEQLTIRTCTVHRLLDSDGSTSGFNLQVNGTTSIGVVNGYIANCDTDACNQAKSICHLTLLAPIWICYFTLLTFFLIKELVC